MKIPGTDLLCIDGMQEEKINLLLLATVAHTFPDIGSQVHPPKIPTDNNPQFKACIPITVRLLFLVTT